MAVFSMLIIALYLHYAQKSAIIKINNQSYKVVLALNQAEQRQGLMNTSFSQLESKGIIGMLFAFPYSAKECFWMHDTEIPLEQIWIYSNGTVNYIWNGTPYSDAAICSYGRYVLEIPNAYKISISPGQKLIVNNSSIS